MTGTGRAPLSFVYHELWTADPEARLSFYRDLFGWTIVREERADGEFLRVQHEGEELARIVPLDAEEGSPDRWNLFLAVPGLDALRGRVESAGGEVLIREQDLPGLGRAGLFMDPLGGLFAAVESNGPPGPAGPTGPGHFCWHDLLTPNIEASSSFYQTTWGVASRSHTPDTSHVHRLLRSEGVDIAGLMSTQDEDHAALWLPYISVRDVVGKVEQAVEAGAEVWLEPTEVDELGTFAVLSDPGRAFFAVRRG